MRGIKETQKLKLGDAHGTPRYSRITKSLSFGMPQKASSLSSSFIGNFTWSYIFIRHMICVLLGASFYFVSFCFLLVRIMFCIFSFNKKVKDSLCHAYFAKYTCCCLKTESLPLLQKFPREVREWYNVETFCIMSSDKSYTAYYFSHNFGVREV